MQSVKSQIEAAVAGWGGFFDAVDYVGRQTVANTLEKYIGISDKKGRYAFFRFDGQNDYTFDAMRTGKNAVLTVSSDIMLIISAKCENIEEIAFAAAYQLAGNAPTGQEWELKSISTDSQKIFEEETGKEWKNNAVRLAAVSFTLKWTEATSCRPLDNLVCQKCF